jgi:hypothetical protein
MKNRSKIVVLYVLISVSLGSNGKKKEFVWSDIGHFVWSDIGHSSLQSAFNLFTQAILICFCHSKLFSICHFPKNWFAVTMFQWCQPFS